MTHQPPPPEPERYDPLTAPPVFDQSYSGPGYGSEPTPQPQQYQLYDQTPEPQYPPVQYPPTVTPHTVPYYPPPREWRNNMGVAALVLGIISLATSCLILGIPAIVCGSIGLGRVRRGEANNRGMAMGGLILGAISTVVMVGVTIVLIIAFSLDAGTTTRYY